MIKKWIFALLLISIVPIQSSAIQFGADFVINGFPWIGANIRLNESIELKPSVQFSTSKESGTFGIGSEFNYYLKELQSLQPYVGVGFWWVNTQNNRFNGSSSKTASNWHGGLRRSITEDISIFGEYGIHMLFDPFSLSTATPVLGITLYLPK